MPRLLALALILVSLSYGAIIPEVRTALSKGDFSGAEKLVQAYRAERGIDPQLLEAMSWIARGALARKDFEKAQSAAEETHQLALAELKKGPLDRDRYLPIALGAAIEVQSHALAAGNRRAEAVALLQKELSTYHATSIRTRIQKNIHLLSLEGKRAPKLEGMALEQLKGRPVLLFFWAHWCGECKSVAPTLARLKTEFGSAGLQIVAPTQRYGYTARGEDAPPDVEARYIEDVRKKFYAPIADEPAPINEENFKAWGASTTPTIVLIDRAGIVRLYHPGRMTYEELKAKLEPILKSAAAKAGA